MQSEKTECVKLLKAYSLVKLKLRALMFYLMYIDRGNNLCVNFEFGMENI